MKKSLIGILVAFGLSIQGTTAAASPGNDVIVLAAPSIVDASDEEDYAQVFDGIVDFDVDYANAIYGHDNVFILVDEETRSYFTGRVPEEILIDSAPLHIWMRDFTTINPHQPVQFRYTPASFEGDQAYADEIQNEFNQLLDEVGINVPQARNGRQYLKLDGGNIVDNYAGRIITTDRFLEDNKLSRQQAITLLKKELNAKEVAILPADDPILAHSDGMVMFSDENTLFVNEYDEPFRSDVLSELRSAFPGVKIIEVEVAWDKEDESSACGINLNATVTSNYIYMPHFGDATSDRVLAKIQKHTSKKVIPVPASGVCKLGGSVRCLSWQQSNKNGAKLIAELGRN